MQPGADPDTPSDLVGKAVGKAGFEPAASASRTLIWGYGHGRRWTKVHVRASEPARVNPGERLHAREKRGTNVRSVTAV
jgi:hypothetical protein